MAQRDLARRVGGSQTPGRPGLTKLARNRLFEVGRSVRALGRGTCHRAPAGTRLLGGIARGAEAGGIVRRALRRAVDLLARSRRSDFEPVPT